MDASQLILANETAIRLGFFVGVFVAVALWELVSPRRVLLLGKAQRWASNLALVALNTVVLRLLFPAAVVGVAMFCAEQGWGLLNHYRVPTALAVPLAVMVLDFAIWLQHVMVHAVPLLWRLHRMHHAYSDTEKDPHSPIFYSNIFGRH